MTRSIRVGRYESQMRFSFKHASADRSETENVIVEIRDRAGTCGYGEGCPRKYVTGETFESACSFLEQYGLEIAEAASNIQSLRFWINAHQKLIDANPSAFCTIELAALDLLGKHARQPLERLLEISDLSEPIAYTAVLGDSSPNKTRAMCAAYRLWGFADFKIKLSGDPERDRKRLDKLPKSCRIRVDANNYWSDPVDCISHLKQLGRAVWAVEEPVAAHNDGAMRAIADELGCKIILDESLSSFDQLCNYDLDPDRWVANIRVSKCGGILRSLRLSQEAQNRGIDVILGAHVGETGLLSRAALTIGQALDRPPIAREGAYGNLLLKRDLTQPSLRFGYGGKLQPSRYGLVSGPGAGLKVSQGAVTWQLP